MAITKARVALMTEAQWKRLAGLRERLRIRDEQQAKALEECCAIPWTHGDRELLAYTERDRRHLIGAEYASKFLRIPLPALLRATAGQPFALAILQLPSTFQDQDRISALDGTQAMGNNNGRASLE